MGFTRARRSALRDDWSTPEGYDGTYTIYPYAISSSNIIVVGGPPVNLAAEYFNDFTDAFIFSEYDGGFYAPGGWARTSQPSLGMSDEVDELWYSSTDVNDDVGHAIISTYTRFSTEPWASSSTDTPRRTPTTQATPSGEGCWPSSSTSRWERRR